jgi:integrase/recombinase XerD
MRFWPDAKFSVFLQNRRALVAVGAESLADRQRAIDQAGGAFPPAVRDWLLSLRSGHTAAAYAQSLGHRAWPMFAAIERGRARTIGPAEAAHLRDQLLRRYGPATVNQTMAALSSLWRELARRGMVDANPWRDMGVPLRVDLGEKILTEDEVRQLILAAAPGRDRTLLRLLYATGARVSEVAAKPDPRRPGARLGLYWRDVRPRPGGGASVTLFGKRGKTRTVGIGPNLTRDVYALSRTHPPDRPLFVTRSGLPMSRWDVYKLIVRCARRAGIDRPVSPHWLRHAHAKHALDHGAPINLVQATLGHAWLSTTGIYTRIDPGEGSGSYLPDLGA